MTEQHLKTLLADLETAINKSDAATRATLVSQLASVTRKLEQKFTSPSQSREAQEEDALEAQFDNLPV